MSHSLPAPDEYLASQTMPPNDLTVDPKYFNVRLVTPIGRFTNVDLVKPRGVKQPDGTISDPRFAITLLFAAGSAEHPIVADLYKAIAAVADAKIPVVNMPDPNNPAQMVQRAGHDLLFMDQKIGGLHYPLRDGKDMYIKNPEKNAIFYGCYFINASMYPTKSDGTPQEPLCYDENNMRCDPSVFQRGDYGRVMVRCTFFGDKPGSKNKGVTFYLEGVQFARRGVKLNSFDADSSIRAGFAAAGAIPHAEPALGSVGPNTGNGSPPGAAPPAAPSATQQYAAGAAPLVQAGFAAPTAPAGYIPPQQPSMPPAQGGARPPGV